MIRASSLCAAVLFLAGTAFAADAPASSHGHAPVPVERVDGESVADAVQRQLHARMEVPCDAILALGEPAEVREALIAATASSMPPWAPLRAASCLTDLAASDDAALGHVKELAARQDQPGFALAIVERLDGLSAERAVQIARSAAANPAPALDARLPGRLNVSRHAEVQQIGR